MPITLFTGITLLSVTGKVINRIILNRKKDVIDPYLHDEQAGFRKNRSCVDQIATLRIIVEQSIEWYSPLYTNFVDYEKAFNSVDRETIWKLLTHYGVPTKSVNIISNSYEGMVTRVLHGGQFTKTFSDKDWSVTRMLVVTIPFSIGRRLGYEDFHRKRE